MVAELESKMFITNGVNEHNIVNVYGALLWSNGLEMQRAYMVWSLKNEEKETQIRTEYSKNSSPYRVS